jgi:hypothetical protein
MKQGRNRLIRGVLEEAAIVTTDKGSYKRITIREPKAVDDETGRSMYFREVYINGKPASESELLAMRGCRLEIHFLADDTCEIRITK